MVKVSAGRCAAHKEVPQLAAHVFRGERVIGQVPRQLLPAELPFQADHIFLTVVVEHGHKPHANQRALLLDHAAQALLVGGAAAPGVIGDDEPGESAGRVSHFLFRVGADADRIKLQ